MRWVHTEPHDESVTNDANAHAPMDASATPARFAEVIPQEYARRHILVSRGSDAHGSELLAISPTTMPSAAFNVGVRLARPIVTIEASAEAIATEIDRLYSDVDPLSGTPSDASNAHESGNIHDDSRFVLEGCSDVDSELSSALQAAECDADVLNTRGKAPAVRLVDLILFEALLRGGSDVHIQPIRGRTLVRYRLDGVLHTVRTLPTSLAHAVVSRVKIMSRMDIAERRAPQDGRAGITVGGSGGPAAGRRVDLRVSALPSTYGERVVIRLLDPSRSPHLTSFSALGMSDRIEQPYLAHVSKTSGIVLSTGPTGSGKTTTLYATLAWITRSYSSHSVTQSRQRSHVGGCELNIMTIEDPVEYDLAGGELNGSRPAPEGSREGLTISQTQVDPKKGLTFAVGLRHILRQDPDVIMVGEIRDEETARIAVQSSLTGHLVLSTLHTNYAASAVARLLDLAIEPFLVSSSLSSVLAQRLVRKRHSTCGGTGCEGCFHTGYKGRTGVFELLQVNSSIREAIGRRASSTELKTLAEKSGMVSLRSAGTELVHKEVTTREEIARVIEAVDAELDLSAP